MIRFFGRRGASSRRGEKLPVEKAPRERGEGDESAAGLGTDSPEGVKGERGTSIAAGARSLQSRMSSVLAAGLMICVGAAMLAWYYADALSHPAGMPGRARSPLPQAPGEGMMLPPFGRIAPPATTRSAPVASAAPPVSTLLSVPEAAGAVSVAALPASSLLEPPLARAADRMPPGGGGSVPLAPGQRRLDRRLAGAVFARVSPGSSADLAAGEEGEGAPSGLAGVNAQERGSPIGSGGDALRRLLRPDVLAATRAQLLPDQHLLLPKGTFIDCTLETAIDSTLPGMTTCITATDTFSADGTVVLLGRGTKLIGETRGQVRQGQARVFVVWTEARTPAGVVVRLDSPGTDALGRSGLEGKVDRHFWQRFGAAALVSTLDGAVQSEVQSSSRGGAVILDPTGSADVLTGILRSTVNIPPTVRVPNGARIQVLVARDVDFRPVYALAPR